MFGGTTTFNPEKRGAAEASWPIARVADYGRFIIELLLVLNRSKCRERLMMKPVRKQQPSGKE